MQFTITEIRELSHCLKTVIEFQRQDEFFLYSRLLRKEKRSILEYQFFEEEGCYEIFF